MKEKFGNSSNSIVVTTNNDSCNSLLFNELKKQDLFDLGILLLISATGGLEVVSEEQINALSL